MKPRIGKFTETESRVVVTGSEGGDGDSVFKAGRVPLSEGGGWW